MTQAHPGYGWSETLSYLRPKLMPPPLCTWRAPTYAPLPKQVDISQEVRSWRTLSGYLAAGAVAAAILCTLIVRIRRGVTGWLRQRAIRGIARRHAPRDGKPLKAGRQAPNGPRPRAGRRRGGELPLSPSQVALNAAHALEAQLDDADDDANGHADDDEAAASGARSSGGAPRPRPKPKPKPKPRRHEETERLAAGDVSAGDVSGDVSDDGSMYSCSGSVYSLCGSRAQGAPLIDREPEVIFQPKGRGRAKKPSSLDAASSREDEHFTDI